jgi:hypothetical protein
VIATAGLLTTAGLLATARRSAGVIAAARRGAAVIATARIVATPAVVSVRHAIQQLKRIRAGGEDGVNKADRQKRREENPCLHRKRLLDPVGEVAGNNRSRARPPVPMEVLISATPTQAMRELETFRRGIHVEDRPYLLADFTTSPTRQSFLDQKTFPAARTSRL